MISMPKFIVWCHCDQYPLKHGCSRLSLWSTRPLALILNENSIQGAGRDCFGPQKKKEEKKTQPNHSQAARLLSLSCSSLDPLQIQPPPPTSVLSPNPSSNSGLHSTAGDPSVPLLSLAVDPLEQRSPRSDQILAPGTLALWPWRPAAAQVGGATMESSAGDAAQVLVKARCSFFLLFLKFKGNQQHTPSSRRTVLLFSDGWMGWSWRRRTTRRIGIPSLLFSSSMSAAQEQRPSHPSRKGRSANPWSSCRVFCPHGSQRPSFLRPIRTRLPVVCTAAKRFGCRPWWFLHSTRAASRVCSNSP
uniref:Uncharacterized protein n=1 Tax=Triticum urartu TaxID=4572 RepID=A0A8R7Q1U4_TRIUA